MKFPVKFSRGHIMLNISSYLSIVSSHWASRVFRDPRILVAAMLTITSDRIIFTRCKQHVRNATISHLCIPSPAAGIFFFGVYSWLVKVLGQFSIIYFKGLGLRIGVRVWDRVRVWVRVWVRVRVRVRVRVSVVLWSE